MKKLLNAILYFLLLMAVDCWPFDEDPVTVSNAPVTARVGESVILPCHLSAEISAVEKEVRWYRVRNNEFSIVLNYATKKSIPEMQNEEYSDRVSFFIQEIEKGNASLQMRNTAFSDEGEYKCCVISDNLHCKIVKLLVPVRLNITENVNAILGTSIILPCFLDTKVSAEDLELRWQKDGLATSVLLYKNKKVVTEDQHEDYRERVRLYTDLRKGDLSLIIEDVRIADEGKYTCSVKAVTQENEGSVYLRVSSVRLKNFPDKISATMGQNTIIPCHLNPEVSALDLEVRWQKEGLEVPVLLYKNRREKQHEQYRGRARLHSDLTKGDLSLILESVRDVDGGRYTCHVRTLSQVNESSLYLSITAHGRKPIITVHKQPGGEIRLKCESKGWYPKPELHWNYGDGSVVPVHPDFSEKVEEDGRITVTSHLSVQDSYEEDFLCIVQLSDSKEKFVSTFHVSVKLKTSESMCLSEINKNVILPCHLDPAVRVLDSEVKWEKKGLTSPVFLYTNRRVALEEHHEQYKERTQLNSEDKGTGDLSLSLKNVKVTDEGRYICSVKAHGREIQASLDLSVTAQGGKPVITVDEEPGNVKLKCISRGWYPKPQLKWTHEDGSAVTEYSELFEEVEHDGRITITSYLSIRDRYDKKILCVVQLSGSKERAVSSIIISRGRPQNFTHLVALICMILVLCYIIMCKKGYAQIKSIFFELFTQDFFAIIVFYLQCKGLSEILLVVAASEINIFLILTQNIQGSEKLKVQNTLLQFVRECLIILGIIWWKINDDSLLLLLAALIQVCAVLLALGTSQEFCLRCLSASVIATMLIIHFSGVTESILPDFQQNSQIVSHVKEFLSNEGTSKYLLLTLLVMQIFIQLRLFLSEKQQANKKLKMLTAFVLCVLECLIIFGTILWVVKGDCTCLVTVGLTQLVLFFILAKHTSQGFYKMCGVTFAAVLLLIFAFCYLENLDIINNMMTDYQNLANTFVSYDYHYMWKEGQIEPLLLTDIILQIFNIFLAFFLLEKPKVRRKLTVSTISLICVHEFFIIIGIVMWNKKGDISLILIAVLIQAIAFILVLVQAMLQGYYKTSLTVFAVVVIPAVLAYADILDKALLLSHYEILAKIVHNCTEEFLWIKGLLIDNWISSQTFIYAFFNDVNNFPGILGANGCPVLAGFVLYLCMQFSLIMTKIWHGNSERIQNENGAHEIIPDDLVKRNKKLKEEYDALKAKYDDLVKRNKKLKEEYDALKAKYDDLVKRDGNKKLNEECDALRAEFDKLGIVPDEVWEKIKECEVDMVLYPDTAHSDISVDNDAAQVRFTGDVKGPNTWCSVTGSDWLKAQQDHYWEVEVGEKGSWAIGLASESIKDKQLNPGPTNGLWIIRLCKGKKLEAISNTDVKECQIKPKKVGLHWEGNCLRVYDKEKKQLIHKFDIGFIQHLYPVFSPGSHDKGPLIIKIKNTETENLKKKFGIALKLYTKYPNINVDNQQIRLTGIEQVAGGFRWPCALADNKLTSEKAYWEVEVGEKSSWALGVVADTKEVKTSIPDEPEEGFWIIKVQAEKIHAVSSGKIRILRKPRKVGVFVDFVEQELSFYDIEKKYLIHRFHIESSEKLYPIFSPGIQDKGPLIII